MKIWAYQTWALIGARQVILEAFIMRKICLISETEFPCVAYKLAYRTLTKDAMALHMGHKAWDKNIQTIISWGVDMEEKSDSCK